MTDTDAYTAAAKRLHAKAALRLDTSRIALSAAQTEYQEADTDLTRYNGLIEAVETGVVPLRFLGELAAEMDEGLDEAAPVVTESRTRLRQDQPGSKSWNEGREARDEGPIAKYPGTVGTVSYRGWCGGFDERSAEINAAAAPDEQSQSAPRADASAEGHSPSGTGAPQEHAQPAPLLPSVPAASFSEEAVPIPPPIDGASIRQQVQADMEAGLGRDDRHYPNDPVTDKYREVWDAEPRRARGEAQAAARAASKAEGGSEVDG